MSHLTVKCSNNSENSLHQAQHFAAAFVLYLCQCLYAGVNVTTCYLRDYKVDGGGCAVVEVIKVWRN